MARGSIGAGSMEGPDKRVRWKGSMEDAMEGSRGMEGLEGRLDERIR